MYTGIVIHNSNLSILGQITCSKMIRDVHLWGLKTSNVNNKNNNTLSTTSIVCISCSPITIFVQFCDLMYVILAVGSVQNSCITPNILKSQLHHRLHGRKRLPWPLEVNIHNMRHGVIQTPTLFECLCLFKQETCAYDTKYRE